METPDIKNPQFVDLHIHSKYARATSKNCDLENLAKNAKIKGLTVLGTGDFTHPIWLKELKSKLEWQDGIYEYGGIKFMPTTELSLVYTQGGKGRRIHHILFAPNLEVVDQINAWIDTKGRRDYDGRPIFGFSSIELVEKMMTIDKNIMIIPAHVWTPWFGLLGSMSGFNSLEECFQDKTKNIHAIETGLSSDPAMNWRVSSLDKYAIVSFSDNHSPTPNRIGRECTLFDHKEITYKKITDDIKNKQFKMTIEFFPEEGKYHYDGHRNCGVSFSPEESNRLKKICPVCKRPMIIGVQNRVEELADRPEGFVPKNAIPFKSFVPLIEAISFIEGTSSTSKKASELYGNMIERFGNEFNILINTSEDDLKKYTSEKLTNFIIRMRKGDVKFIPGFDGVYGKPILDQNNIPKLDIKPDKPDIKKKTGIKIKEKSLGDFLSK
ncbi:MAG: DNA helicase UvrD [Candidatus Aenigmarchaeota archaeon]|nr:DNA helicase UvrD [Candidatus Aenigmarchaeota archaeon]